MDNKGNKDIENILIDEIATILAIDTKRIQPDIPLADLGLDSLSFVELLVAIEKKFGINLMESGLSKKDFESINSLVQRINEISKQ